MEYKDKMRIAVTVFSLAVLTVVILTRRHRKRRINRPRTSCYLHSDQKPQLSFKRVLADNSFTPFKHLNQGSDKPISHPYEVELNALIENSPPQAVTELGFGDGSCNVSGMSDENCVWVGTESELVELADTLSKERVFAVDTEQHNLRSFLGFTALVQISTKVRDYLVDAIALHDVMGVLRPVFADPSICKVFHGADNDVLWLQRDFHIYVVNLFDTAKVCETLSKPQKSLAYLLETYCGVSTNKLLQREDWRQRPLSAEMLEYARTDAHYLLYIASCLVAELKKLSSNDPSSVYDELHFTAEASCRSNMICLQLYSKETEIQPGESVASAICSRRLNGQGSSLVLSETQDIVRRLCAWRDILARIHDESVRFVLSDHSIVLVAVKVPKSAALLYDTIALADLNGEPASVSSLQSPSPVVCSHLEDLFFLIHEKDDPENVFQMLIHKCLGPNGSCPLSLRNYALLFNHDLRFSNSMSTKQNGSRNAKHIARKASRDLFVQKFSCKAPVYHNCRIYANDGRLLCYCDRRKLEWYLRRDLAKLVDDEPPAIMLLFEPKGHPEDEDNDFYVQSKKNVCVSCGEGSHYLRYRIIPSCYRMHFPEHLKSHRSHDIVLLCVDCHEVAHAAAEKYKKQVAAEFGIPLFVRKVVDSKEQPTISWPDSLTARLDEAGVSPLQLRTAAMALLRHGQRMPPKRHSELMQTVMQYYGGRDITEEDLEKALLVGMSPHERRKFEKKRRFSLKHGFGKNPQDTQQNNVATKIASDGAPRTNDSISGNFGESCSNGAADLQFGHDESTPSKLSLLGHGPHGKQVVDHILEHYGEDGIRDFCQKWRKVFVEATQPRFLPAGWDVMHSGRRDFGEFSVYNPAKKASVAKC